MTAEQVRAYEMRQSRGKQGAATEGVEKESGLHNEIISECARRGWLPFHGSMAHRSFKTPGEPDFVILASNGRMFLIECKSKTGKLSPDQQAIAAWAAKLGHTIHVVRSMAEFLEVVK